MTRLAKKRLKAESRKEIMKATIAAQKPHPPYVTPKMPDDIRELLDKFGAEQPDMKRISPENVMFAMAPSLESFFSRNEINLSNFNKLMKIFAQQALLTEAREAVSKVKVWPI